MDKTDAEDDLRAARAELEAALRARNEQERVDRAFDGLREAFDRWYDFAATQGCQFDARYGRMADAVPIRNGQGI